MEAYLYWGHEDCGDHMYGNRGCHLGRVADPVHLRPDPDPANQNFKNLIRILLALTYQESIQTSKFFFTSNIFFLIFEWWLFWSEQMEKFTWKCVKALFLKYFSLLYTTLYSQSGTDRIRIRRKFSGSATVHLGAKLKLKVNSNLNWTFQVHISIKKKIWGRK